MILTVAVKLYRPEYNETGIPTVKPKREDLAGVFTVQAVSHSYPPKADVWFLCTSERLYRNHR